MNFGDCKNSKEQIEIYTVVHYPLSKTNINTIYMWYNITMLLLYQTITFPASIDNITAPFNIRLEWIRFITHQNLYGITGLYGIIDKSLL